MSPSSNKQIVTNGLRPPSGARASASRIPLRRAYIVILHDNDRATVIEQLKAVQQTLERLLFLRISAGLRTCGQGRKASFGSGSTYYASEIENSVML
jgi:hypothetical protein